MGSSAPFHLVYGILRFRINIWHFIKAFRRKRKKQVTIIFKLIRAGSSIAIKLSINEFSPLILQQGLFNLLIAGHYIMKQRLEIANDNFQNAPLIDDAYIYMYRIRYIPVS